MQEIWKSFVYPLIKLREKNVKEEEYHICIENQMTKLGWRQYDNEILHKQNVIGGRNFIQPDIVVQKDGDVQFVIEVKKPVYTQTRKDVGQLVSYIRQLKKEVGIYIGEHIEIFYDKPGEIEAISVMTIPLELDSKRGARFVDLFSREKFDKDSIVDFCEECIKEQQRQESLNKIKESLIVEAQSQVAEALSNYLTDKYNGTFTEGEIRKMLSSLSFTVSSEKTSSQHTPATSPDSQNESLNNTSKRVKDNTKYSLNGIDFHPKNRFVRELVKEYVRLHPEKTYAELEQIFPPTLQGSYGVFQSLDYIHTRSYNGNRFFTNEDETLKSSDGIVFAVSSEWSKNNIPNIIKVAKGLGFNVITSEENISEKDKEVIQNSIERVPCVLTRGGINARGLFNPNDQSMILLKGSRINKSYSQSLRRNEVEKRNKKIAQYTEEHNGNLYASENIPFKTPSGAAVFCVGCSSNGWVDWKDEKGNNLMLYRSK